MTKAQEGPQAAIPCTVSRSGCFNHQSVKVLRMEPISHVPLRILALSLSVLFFCLGYLARFGPTLSIQEPLEIPRAIPGCV